ncbi:CheR family methyltransferase [Confluentibacter citreus]|uniref:CheR family methyltransferase n=1 Tax=Confluentibacter citreus TaxID=2007307 RepID=UPI001EFD0F02|nr:CheR family methyltransferase [Confluentibacter citreus]
MIELLQHLPSNTGMAFIYVQHLSPDHKSMLTEILSNKTEMKVQEIDDMDKIKPNNVFVIPYNKGIEVTDGHIKLIPRSELSTAITIDILFSSLAHAQKERVIGIVLSGSASDGTIGIKDIKHEGGLTFAQDDTAKFTSMPRSAISAGVIDFILSPKDIALELARLSKHPLVKASTKTNSEDLIDNSDPDLKIILNQLHKATGVDFSAYKMNTIKRRIIRRMLLYKIENLKDYAKLLSQKNEEIDILFQDLLINVTSFFRDTDTHRYLKESLFPKLLKSKNLGDSLRIWIPACATGQEAYSMAIMLLEVQESLDTNIPVQIFATDLSEGAIGKARVGVYTKEELETVSPKRVQRFFTKADGSFRVNKSLRDMCVFAPHNILRDPPFSRLDFISCCNLFIYLDTVAQKKAVNTFHYALNSNGFLMLGKSENISHSSNLFTITNKKYKIFSRKINSGPQRLPELSQRLTHQTVTKKNVPLVQRNVTQQHTVIKQHGLDQAIDAVLVAEFMPASVVINHQMEIIQFRGITDVFLTHPKGRATFNILKMARPEIAFELRNAISKVIKTEQKFRKSGIELKINSTVKIISLEIVPLNIEWQEPLLLILFTEQEPTEIYSQLANSGGNNSPAKDRRIKKLEQELEIAHSDALSIAQEQEAFTEELQSAHEEVVSSNEELQTLNEELETSKEEIESANEELTTTNQELQTRNDLLNESYEYSNAIVSTMHEPMLILGKDLRVKSANKAFYEKFGVTEEQTEGILLYDLGNKQWDIPALRELLEDIIPKNSPLYNYEVKHTFLDLGEKIMSLNASRIIQKTHREQLILLIIADITEVRRLIAEKELREKELLKKEINERKTEKSRLEQAVTERTQELKEANELLEHKNQELVNMNKELEAFTYVSSHDLQEPLRKLKTFAGIILENEKENLSDKGKNYFQLMQQAAERMRQLIQDLLAFSRISAEERTFENTDLNIIIEDVLIEFKEAIAEKHAVIELKEICEVYIIPFQFRQLMHNLISNALKFSNPKTPPHITIESRNIKFSKENAANLPLQKEYCHISIIDNGIGFEKEFSKKIFEVFQKLHGKEEYAGTGIGLAIVKKIVDNHDGIITATSEVNKGTTFDIYIPTLLQNDSQ